MQYRQTNVQTFKEIMLRFKKKTTPNKGIFRRISIVNKESAKNWGIFVKKIPYEKRLGSLNNEKKSKKNV